MKFLVAICFYMNVKSHYYYRSLKVKHNGFPLAVGGDFEAQNCQFALTFISSLTVYFPTYFAITRKWCLSIVAIKNYYLYPFSNPRFASSLTL